MAVNHFIQWHYDMRDCQRQIGVSWSCVHLGVWQMRQRHATWEPCRVKDSLRHANKSWLTIPSGGALSVFHSRQLLSFTVTRVSRTHCILHCTVTVCQLIISLLQCLLSVCGMLSLQRSNTATYIWQLLLIYLCFLKPPYCSHGSLLLNSQRKIRKSFTVSSSKEEILFLPSSPRTKRRVSATFNLTHAVRDSTRPSADGETSVRFDMEMAGPLTGGWVVWFQLATENPPRFLFQFHLAEIFTECTPIHLRW